MTSEARAALVFAVAWGCTTSVHDRSVDSAPLLVIRGHVDVATLERPHPDRPLLAALVWAAVPAVNPVCLRFDQPELRQSCPDPYGVFPRQVQSGAPVQPDGSFAIALDGLPGAGASVGDEVTRITYGSLLVIEDVNADGLANLPSGGGGPKRGPVANNDTIVAATFHSLRAPQARIVLREGAFVADSHFYPAPGCPAPPPGFSVLLAPPYPVDGAAPGPCTTRGLEAPIEVAPLSPAQAQAFACRGWNPGGFRAEGDVVGPGIGVHRARSDGPLPDGIPRLCINRELMVFVVPDVCPVLVVFALKGCLSDPLCAVPEWDDTAMPPPWWTCH